MNKQLVQGWRTLMVAQRDLVCEYLKAVGGGISPGALAEMRDLLADVAVEVEALRKCIPGMSKDPYCWESVLRRPQVLKSDQPRVPE